MSCLTIRELLIKTSAAYKAFKAAYKPGMTCGKMQESFKASLEKDLPGYKLKWDFLCGADTVNIDGVTDGDYIPQSGDTVIIDASVSDGKNWCDVCRTYFVGGVSTAQRRVFNLVLASIREGEKTLTAGCSAGRMYDSLNAVYKSAGKELVHHAGHMIGKEPLMQPQFLKNRKEMIEAERCYTIESGLYEEFGLRLENDYQIKDNGADNLFEDLLPLILEEYIL